MFASKNTPSTSRKRQFSNVRSHVSNSRSQQNSLRSSFMKKMDVKDLANTRFTNNPVQQSKTASGRRRTEVQANSVTKMLCTGCFNHELLEAKSRKKNRDRQESLRREQQLSKSIDDFSKDGNQLRRRFARQYQKMNEYNKNEVSNKMEIKKDIEILEREVNNRIRMETDIEERKQFEEKRRVNEDRKERIRKQLEQQIQRRRRRDAQQKSKQKTEQNMFILNDPLRNTAHQRFEKNYRKQLSQQIEQQRKKRKDQELEERQRKKLQADSIIMEAAEKQKLRKMYVEKKRSYLLEEAKRRKQQEGRKKIDSMHRKKQEQRARIEQLELFNRLNTQKEKIRQNQVAGYLKVLKEQLKIQQQKKRQQKSYDKLPIGSLFNQERPVLQSQCDSCEKKFPRLSLTAVTQPFEI